MKLLCLTHRSSSPPLPSATIHRPDDWTSATEDGQRSAQFEHTILVTETGFELLTARTADSRPLWWEEEAAEAKKDAPSQPAAAAAAAGATSAAQ